MEGQLESSIQGWNQKWVEVEVEVEVGVGVEFGSVHS